MHKLPREFYMGDTLEISRALIGRLLVRSGPDGVAAGRIVETEAYLGAMDAAAHSYKRSPSGRTNIQYGPGGYAYVYLIYGMYCCMNVVTGEEGRPECVLIRALEPIEGIELMQRRRRTDRLRSLCSGPGKLCMALGITRADYGADLCGGRLYVLEREGKKPEIAATPRINIDYAPEHRDKPWRFVDRNSKYLSVKLK